MNSSGDIGPCFTGFIILAAALCWLRDKLRKLVGLKD